VEATISLSVGVPIVKTTRTTTMKERKYSREINSKIFSRAASANALSAFKNIVNVTQTERSVRQLVNANPAKTTEFVLIVTYSYMIKPIQVPTNLR